MCIRDRTNTLIFKRIAVLISLIIVSLILWNTYIFFQKFKTEERVKMESYGDATQELNTLSLEDLNKETSLLPLKIIQKNKNTPLILVSSTGKINGFKNLDSIKSLDPNYLKEQLEIMKKQNDPIAINYLGQTDYIYYKDSDLPLPIIGNESSLLEDLWKFPFKIVVHRRNLLIKPNLSM